MQELAKSLSVLKSMEKQRRSTVLNNKNLKNTEVKENDKAFDEYNWYPDSL